MQLDQKVKHKDGWEGIVVSILPNRLIEVLPDDKNKFNGCNLWNQSLFTVVY